ncbi:MAG: hypothetical protein P8X63_08005 [Desulfuromonadaceae bacterium]|jgi:hypothetical protein
MDELNQLALSALDAAIATLLPASVPGGLTREVRLLPEAVLPAGIGGYIGLHPEPRGEIYGRRLRARLQISIRGGNEGNASSYLDQIVQGLLTQHQGDLRREGLQSLSLRPDSVDTRNAQFDLSFEYRHLPTVSGGIIQDLDLSVANNRTPYRGRFVADLACSSLSGLADPLADFFAPDDLDLNASSPTPAWSYNSVAGCIEQTSTARGGPLTLTQARKAGPQLLWRPSAAPLNISRFIASVEFASGSPDGIGLVFGRSDADNLCYFLASERHQYQLFGCRQGGSYRFIGSPVTDVGLELNSRHRLSLTVYDQTLIATLDGVQTLAVIADTPVPKGELGLFTHGNNSARFYRVQLIELI